MLCNLPQRRSLPSRRNLLTGMLYRFKRFNVVLVIKHLSCNNTLNNKFGNGSNVATLNNWVII